jgi:multidrug efflux pump subunit AcrA (membrane-fusion protein)
VSVGQPLAVVSSNDRLYLAADVSERYAARIPGICDANFRLQYGDRVYSASGLGGRLVSYGRNTGEASPFIPVTFVLNRTEDIIPGSYAEIWLMGEERDNVISLPVSALTEEQGVYFVYVRLDEDCYRKQPVTVGATDGLRAEILSGLEGGEMVVVEGAIHVRLASASNAIPAHTHNH